MAMTSGAFSKSVLRTMPMTCVSLWWPSGKRGRMGRSIMRETRTSGSVGLPSRLKKPPGMRPPA